VGVTPHQGARESRAQGEGAQVVACPEPVRYARCGTPKQAWSLCERCSQEATGELLEIERLTSSLERGHWKSTRQGNSLVVYSTASTVLNGGDEETCSNVTRLVPTQLRQRLRRSVRLLLQHGRRKKGNGRRTESSVLRGTEMAMNAPIHRLYSACRHARDRRAATTLWWHTIG
jgi:hypothetical protein